jgi:hypothetical protein
MQQGLPLAPRCQIGGVSAAQQFGEIGGIGAGGSSREQHPQQQDARQQPRCNNQRPGFNPVNSAPAVVRNADRRATRDPAPPAFRQR